MSQLVGGSTLSNVGYRRIVARAGHPAAALGAFPAHPGAFFHSRYPLAALGTGFTDFGASPANLAGESGTAKHEVRRSLTHLRTVHHEAKMVGFDMFAARLKAMIHRFVQAGLMAFSTGIDAGLHLGVGSVSHGDLLEIG